MKVGKLLHHLLLSILMLTLLGACKPSIPQDRMFLDISVDFLGEYKLKVDEFQDTSVGGLSAITYDTRNSHLYALADDRSNKAPARFYTLNLNLNQDESGEVNLDQVAIENVTFLRNSQGETYAPGSIDPEGIALSPEGTLYISSEGATSQGIPPFIGEFKLETGEKIDNLRLPQRYLTDTESETPESPRGIQNNLGFEALTIKSSGGQSDPFRLFTAPESALAQDILPVDSDPEFTTRVRFLHYLIQPISSPILVAEHLYLLDKAPTGSVSNGLTELLAIDPEGFFLSLERTYGLLGFGAKIFQVSTVNVSDTSAIDSLSSDINGVKPLKKELLLDLNDLDIYLDNLEGMALIPRLPDGSQGLLLVSDNNFNPEQVTQFLLFRLNK